MAYEREMGRKPEEGNPGQAGWDIRSTDPRTGEERLIEVKGKEVPWTGDEVVELTAAQARTAMGSDGWYLYVVERSGDGTLKVHPLWNPVQRTRKWILSGKSWRLLAEVE